MFCLLLALVFTVCAIFYTIFIGISIFLFKFFSACIISSFSFDTFHCIFSCCCCCALLSAFVRSFVLFASHSVRALSLFVCAVYPIAMSILNCGICVADLSDGEVIQCYGVCGRSFHYACIEAEDETKSYKKVLIEYMRKIPNLQWYCETCLPLSVNGLVSTFKDCALALNALRDAFSASHSHAHVGAGACMPNIFSGANCNAIPVCNLGDNSNASVNVSTTPAMNGKRKIVDLRNSAARKKVQRLEPAQIQETIVISPPQTTESSSQPMEMSHATTESVFPVPIQPSRTSRILYVSGFDPRNEVGDIDSLLKRGGIDTHNLVIDKLVSNFRRQRSMTFVSFKISAPEELFGRISDPSLWPKGIVVREFVNKPRNDIKGSSNTGFRAGKKQKVEKIEARPTVSSRRPENREKRSSRSLAFRNFPD